MLKAHLDPNTDAASYRPEKIDRSVTWLIKILGLNKGMAVLDLGCGPGLYAARLAGRGLRVTGVDYSRQSMAYAREYAQAHDLSITYRYQNYLALTDQNQYDAALLISGDYGPLSPDMRRQLLKNVYCALKPNGYFALDVATPNFSHRLGKPRCYVAEGGFWRTGWHKVCEQGFDYPEDRVHLDQYEVIEADGSRCIYRNWMQVFTLETISNELERHGFRVDIVGRDLMGNPLVDKAELIGLVTRKLTTS